MASWEQPARCLGGVEQVWRNCGVAHRGCGWCGAGVEGLRGSAPWVRVVWSQVRRWGGASHRVATGLGMESCGRSPGRGEGSGV